MGNSASFEIKPDSEVAKQLSAKFDQFFSTKTGYEQLDERIGKTKKNKEHLLKVLVLPEVPLHNNAAELAARAKVRKRDVSLQTITDEGTKANDTLMTIVQTAKKLLHFFTGKIRACYERPRDNFPNCPIRWLKFY